MLDQAVLSTAAAFLSTSQNVISLVGSNWTLSNNALNISVPAHLPSQAHLDLYAAKVIEHPLYDLNEFEQRWVAFNNWTYTSDPIQGLIDHAASTWLRFDGLDTFASISFCDEFVAYTENQFRQYHFDVTDILRGCRPKDRVLSINFGPAPLIANATAEAPGQETWPDGIQWTYEFANAHLIRKEHNDFGWDWGPAFSPAGPWQPAYLVQLGKDAVHVRNQDIDIYREGQLPLLPPDQTRDWIVNVSLDLIGHLPDNVQMLWALTDELVDGVGYDDMIHINRTGPSITGMAKIAKDKVKLWWPNGLGDQTMYFLTILILSEDDVLLETITKRVGFRTIVLDMSPVSHEQISQGVAPGNNWHFEVNGHEFYALGSNFIPPDPFWPNVTVERISDLFDSVVEGNQNMLRIWATGAYCPDFLYDLADERGILLWSEFQFGDHLYPVNAGFLENVRQEAEYNVRRANHHPSLALWAGGNELESLMLETAKKVAPGQYDRLVAEYEKLFIDTLGSAVFANTRSISYTPSSTGNGWLTLDYSIEPLHPFTERYNNKTAGHIYGNRDYYNYDPNILGDLARYPVGRFTNEFGFLSLPSLQSWRQQVSEDQLYLNSNVTVLRNHHEVPGGLNTSNFDAAMVGQNQMMAAVETWYPTPNKTDRLANFTAWIYATQVFQADFYTSQISFYRRGSGMPERQLGSLYWQLEDQWVAPTWAGIEHDGRWKMLHYAAKDFYEPVIIAPYYNASTALLEAYVTSSLWKAYPFKATVTWYDWRGSEYISYTKSHSVGALNTTRVLATDLMQVLASTGTRDIHDLVVRLNVELEGELPNTEEIREFRHESWFHPSPLRIARMVEPGLKISYSTKTDTFTVTASSGIAAWVWVDYPDGVVLTFSTNGFWLVPGETRELSYRIKRDTTDGKWKDHVTVRSMWDLTTTT